jgi:hypothetical protein
MARLLNQRRKMQTIWISTDLEPDDVLALYRRSLRKAHYYVVGEGDNPNIKYNRMKRYCQLLGNDHAIVIQGFRSKKPFPNDGKEFDYLENEQNNEDYMTHFKKFATSSNPTMFSLKPMRELTKYFAEDKNQVKELTKNVTLYVYGGFNFRCLVREFGSELLELLHSFKKVCIYESHHATRQNSVTKKNFPLLYNHFQKHSNDPYIQILSKLTKIWNCHLLDEMKERLEIEPDQKNVERLNKIISDIEGNEDFQFVLADFALTSIYDKIEPYPIKNLRFDEEGYLKFDDTTDPTNIYTYKNIEISAIEKHIIDGL